MFKVGQDLVDCLSLQACRRPLSSPLEQNTKFVIVKTIWHFQNLSKYELLSNFFMLNEILLGQFFFPKIKTIRFFQFLWGY